MAKVYLGASIASAILLPSIRWEKGHMPAFPIVYAKNIDKSGTLSGGRRFNYKATHQRRWEFYWDNLTGAEMADLVGLSGLNQRLYFQNGWEGADWKEVVVMEVAYFSPVVKTNLCGGYFLPTIYSIPNYGDPYYQGIYSPGSGPSFSMALTLEEAN